MDINPLDESGKPVEWWFIYKVPQLSGGRGTAEAKGYEYAYYDDPSADVIKSPNTLDQDQGALRRTIDAIFTKPAPTTGWILYNDEKPACAAGPDDGELGHTKGLIAFDVASKTALWMLHSWPKFVNPDSTQMPTPMYGQTFICIALSLESAQALARQMVVYQQPQVYESYLPSGFQDDALCQLAQSVQVNATGAANTIDLQSRNGKLPFKVIAKNRNWGRDFWNALVGPVLQTDINVDTWIRGKNQIPPVADTDGIHRVYDVKYITLKPLGLPWAWPETHDHAKWAVSHTDNWVCVGDINRMISQEKRGGCTIAFQDQALWTLLSKTDLLDVPSGMAKDAAQALIRKTHVAPTVA